MLNSDQLLTQLFLASLLNGYLSANRSYSHTPQYRAEKPQAHSQRTHRSSYSEQTPSARPMTAEEKSKNEVKARAFKLLNISGNAPSDYAVLGVQENANPASVKKAFYSLSRKFHPDKYQGNDKPAATEAFTLVSEAYARLAKS